MVSLIDCEIKDPVTTSLPPYCKLVSFLLTVTLLGEEVKQSCSYIYVFHLFAVAESQASNIGAILGGIFGFFILAGLITMFVFKSKLMQAANNVKEPKKAQRQASKNDPKEKRQSCAELLPDEVYYGSNSAEVNPAAGCARYRTNTYETDDIYDLAEAG